MGDSFVASASVPKSQSAFHFECRVCLRPIAICGPSGQRLWCEAHCPDHQFSYRPELRETRCDNCETRRDDDA